MTTLYRTPNIILASHEWHAMVRLKAGRVARRFYFRPLSSKPHPWSPIEKWVGHKPKGREWAKAFAPFTRHMLLAERSVVENGRKAKELRFKAGDKVSTGHTLKRLLAKSPHPSCAVNDTDLRAWEYQGGGWDYESTFAWPSRTCD